MAERLKAVGLAKGAGLLTLCALHAGVRMAFLFKKETPAKENKNERKGSKFPLPAFNPFSI